MVLHAVILLLEYFTDRSIIEYLVLTCMVVFGVLDTITNSQQQYKRNSNSINRVHYMSAGQCMHVAAELFAIKLAPPCSLVSK